MLFLATIVQSIADEDEVDRFFLVTVAINRKGFPSCDHNLVKHVLGKRGHSKFEIQFRDYLLGFS